MSYYPTHEEFLDEIKKLIHVPNIYYALYHKVEELKEIYNGNITEYRTIWELTTSSRAETDAVETVDFVLTRQGKKWIPSIPDIPIEIIDYILQNSMMSIIPMPSPFSINGKKYKVSFEMQDKETITGTIEMEGHKRGENSAHTGTEPDVNRDELKEFLECMLFHPELYRSIMAQFRLKWKPGIEKIF